MGCVQRSKPVDLDPFPGGEGWIGGEFKDENAANRLTLLCIDLPSIRARASALIKAPYDTALVSEALNLLQQAQTVDENLQQWYETLPDTWQRQPVGIESGWAADAVADGEAWPGEQHVYPDVSIAGIINDYRVCRIFCQHVIIHCATWLQTNPEHELTSTYDRAAYIIQRTADDIAASVPFHLSYDMQPTAQMLGQERIGKSCLLFHPTGLCADSSRHVVAAEAFGGYSLVWPLYVAAHAETVPQAQKSWFLNRLEYIGTSFGLSNVQVLAMAKQHVLSCGPLFP